MNSVYSLREFSNSETINLAFSKSRFETTTLTEPKPGVD